MTCPRALCKAQSQLFIESETRAPELLWLSCKRKRNTGKTGAFSCIQPAKSGATYLGKQGKAVRHGEAPLLTEPALYQARPRVANCRSSGPGPRLQAAHDEGKPESARRGLRAGAGLCESRAWAVGGRVEGSLGLIGRPSPGDRGARSGWQEPASGLQSGGGDGRRRSSGRALGPQWLRLPALVGSPPLLNKPGWSPPSQTSPLWGGGGGEPAGVRPRPEPCPGPGRAAGRAGAQRARRRVRAGAAPLSPGLPAPTAPLLGEGAGAESGASGGAGSGRAERTRPMGNTLTCCVSPNASPKLGRRAGPAEPDYESETYAAAAGDAVAVAPTPAAAVEPSELDFGAGEGHHLQHISDREMPEGEGAACASRPRRTPGLHLLPGSRREVGGGRRLGFLTARSRLARAWAPGGEGCVWLASPPLILPGAAAGQFLSHPYAQFLFSSRPRTLQPPPLPLCNAGHCPVGLYQDFMCLYVSAPFPNKTPRTLTSA